jgi:hypothetical protein
MQFVLQAHFYDKKPILKEVSNICHKKEPYCFDDMYRAGRAPPYNCAIKNTIALLTKPQFDASIASYGYCTM